MIRLTRAVVTSRPWHALALFLLGALAIGAAVAAPAYARTAQASVASTNVASATPGDRSVIVRRSVKLKPFIPEDPSDTPTNEPDLVPRQMPTRLLIGGYDTVYNVTVHAAGGRSVADYFDVESHSLSQNTVLSLRSNSCAHVTVVAGRCIAAPLEVMVSESTAEKLNGIGTWLEIQFEYPLSTRDGVKYVPIGDPQRLSVVGVYRVPRLATDPYWAGSPFAFAGSDELTGLVSSETFDIMKPWTVDQSYMAYPLPGALSPDRLAGVRADLDRSLRAIREANSTAESQLPDLLTRIESDQRQAAIGPAVAGVPLVVLCWFVIFLAVAQTAQARRPELALLKLRGTGPVDRWWLSAAESVVPLVLGAVAGFFLGHLGVRLFGRLTLDHPGPVAVSQQSLVYGGAALAGALVAGMAALRRDLAAPIAELMRRVTRQTWRWQSAVLISVVATLAAVAVFEAHDNLSPEPTGLVLLGPALIVLAVGLLLAGLLDPLAERVGRFALRRGRLGLGLAALQLGRPRNSRRVVALLTIAVGLFVFAVTANDVSSHARQQLAQSTLGASRVLTVSSNDPTSLLNGVRSVDPDGSYAMAVQAIAADQDTGVPVLFVDSTRLATVAYWPGDRSAADAARAIRPQLSDPVIVRGRDMLVDAVFTGGNYPQNEAEVQFSHNAIEASFAPLDGGLPVLSSQALLQPGRHTYRLEMPCLDGCRLTGITTEMITNPLVTPTLTITAVRSSDGATTLVSGEELGHWLDHSRGQLTVTAVPSGVELKAESDAGNETPSIRPPDQTDELPVVSTVSANVRSFRSITGNFFASQVNRISALPRLGAAGGLADLELALRDGLLLRGGTAEVWLTTAAPPDVVDRLGKAGLTVTADRRLADAVRDAGQRPNALGWRFFAVLGALAVVLGVAGLWLAASVERRNRAYALRAMRAQGLPWRSVTAAGLIGYLSIVVCGLVFGAGAAMIAWWIDGAYLPIVEGRPLGQGLPGWPSSLTFGWWAVATAALVAVAIVATAALVRGVRIGRRVEFGGGSAA